MPIEIYIAELVACSFIVILTILLIATAIYLKVKVDSMEKSVAQVKGELMDLIQESRAVVSELKQFSARMSQPMADIEEITRTARSWTARTDRLVDTLGTIAEPPLFFLSKKIKIAEAIFSGVLQTLLNPKR